MPRDFVIGLDLGQAVDFSALAVLQRLAPAPGEKPGYAVRHLQRFQLGTAYTAIVPGVSQVVSSPPLKGSHLVVDHTGVGRALVDMLRKAPGPGRVVPVTITAGQAITLSPDGSYHVPKKELVTGLQLVLQGRRLQLARELPDAGVLVRELENFRVKITPSANETFGAWGSGQHDDLVIAVALAVWWAERYPQGLAVGFDHEGGLVADMLKKL